VHDCQKKPKKWVGRKRPHCDYHEGHPGYLPKPSPSAGPSAGGAAVGNYTGHYGEGSTVPGIHQV